MRHITFRCALLFTSLTCLSLCLIGCGDDAESSEEPQAMGCVNPPSGECFRADWTVSGAQLTAELTAAEPSEPVKGSNTWTVALRDMDGEALLGCEVTLTPYMPDHGHGSNVVESSELEDGRYELEGFELTMPGLWELNADVTCPELEMDSFTFELWLES